MAAASVRKKEGTPRASDPEMGAKKFNDFVKKSPKGKKGY